MARWRVWRRRTALGALLLLAAGCARPNGDDHLLRKAYELGEAYEWEAVRSYAKRYLTEHPDSAPGHMLYGRSYLRLHAPNLAIAKGELDTALALFNASPDLGVLADTWNPGKFVGDIHHEMATVYLRHLHALSSEGVGAAVIQHDLEEARRHVDLGLEADPSNPSLQLMRKTLADLGSSDASVPA